MRLKASKGAKCPISVLGRKDGQDGVVVAQRVPGSQRAAYVLLTPEEWLELRGHVDGMLGTGTPKRKRYRMA